MNPVLATKTRVPVWVDADDPIVSQHLLQTGDWDAPLADVLEKALRPDDVFLDLGAHVGYFSLIAAPHCKRVIAVEPQAELCLLLRKSAEGTNIEVNQCAVGSNPLITQNLLWVPLNRGAASLMPTPDGVAQLVATKQLADLSDHATVAKIDIEGDDLPVLKANPDFLAGLRMIAFEYHAGNFELFHLIQDAGFDIYSVDYGQLRIDPPELPDGFYTNLVGFRR